MLDFFFRHYDPWVTRFIFIDDYSNDETREFLRSRPNVEVRDREDRITGSKILSGTEIRNHCWKESRGIADWVVLTAIDEHLHHPNLQAYLKNCKTRGVTLIPALGYEMLTDDFPAMDEHLAQTRTRGVPSEAQSKLVIFDPDAIIELNRGPGGHWAHPCGDIALPERDELQLLHYKYLGIDYPLERNSFLATGLLPGDLKNDWGAQYRWTREDYVRVCAELSKNLVDIADPEHLPWRDHREARWWRDPKWWNIIVSINKFGRNDPCPCGSGKKYKQCHGHVV